MTAARTTTSAAADVAASRPDATGVADMTAANPTPADPANGEASAAAPLSAATGEDQTAPPGEGAAASVSDHASDATGAWADSASAGAAASGADSANASDPDLDVGDLLGDLADDAADAPAVVDDSAAVSPSRRSRRPANEVLPKIALKLSLSGSERRRLRGHKRDGKRRPSLAVVVQAPGPTWIEPLGGAIRELGDWDIVRATFEPAKRKHGVDAAAAAEVARALAKGWRVVGVSHAPSRGLPAPLVAGCDLWVKVAVSDEVIRRTILSVCGRRPVDLPPGVAAGLDFNGVCSAIRLGETAERAVLRLKAAAAAQAVVDPTVAAAPAFETLSGFGEAKAWGEALIADLAEWRAGRIAFEAISTRAVLASPPGLGKTMFVRSLARALGLPLIATSVSAWFAQTAGNLDDVIKAADEVFATAAAVAPAIVFLDELDAVPDRASLSPRGRDWWTPVVTHLLLVLDSAVSGENGKTIVLGATNHPERLDSALVRPGRLDRILRIGPPDAAARVGILAVHLKNDLEGVDLGEAANLAEGMSGAELAEAVKRARRAARVAGRPLALADLIAAIAPPDARPEAERWRTAVHEAGHAVAMLAVGQPAKSVSIVESRGAGGMTVKDAMSVKPSKASLEAHIVSLLAGRAAEEVILGDPSAGAGGTAASDLAQATGLLASLHASLGLRDTLMWRAPPEEATTVANLDLELRDKVEDDLRRLYDEALALIRQRLSAVNAVAECLLARRRMLGEEVERIANSAGGVEQDTKTKRPTDAAKQSRRRAASRPLEKRREPAARAVSASTTARGARDGDPIAGGKTGSANRGGVAARRAARSAP